MNDALFNYEWDQIKSLFVNNHRILRFMKQVLGLIKKSMNVKTNGRSSIQRCVFLPHALQLIGNQILAFILGIVAQSDGFIVRLKVILFCRGEIL